MFVAPFIAWSLDQEKKQTNNNSKIEQTQMAYTFLGNYSVFNCVSWDDYKSHLDMIHFALL